MTRIGVAKDTSTGSTIANVQIGVPLPIFNRNQGNVDLAHAEYHRAVSDVERLQLALRNRLWGESATADVPSADNDNQSAIRNGECGKQ